MKLRALAGTLVAALGMSTSANAQINGWFDYIYVSMADDAYGWICDSSNPTATPSEVSLVVYVNGTYYNEYPLAGGNWGGSRPDAAYMCNGYEYSGFHLVGWLASSNTSIYYKDAYGNLTMLGGSPKNCTTIGYCY